VERVVLVGFVFVHTHAELHEDTLVNLAAAVILGTAVDVGAAVAVA